MVSTPENSPPEVPRHLRRQGLGLRLKIEGLFKPPQREQVSGYVPSETS